jgi:hypothetical protein
MLLHHSNFDSKVALALETVQKLVASTKHPVLCDKASDILYEDKFLLSEFLTSSLISASFNCFAALGCTAEQLGRIHGWAASRAVTMRFTATEECSLLRKEEREVPSNKTNVLDVKSGNTSVFSMKSYTVETVVEYFWKFKSTFELIIYAGTGETEGDRIIIKRDAVSEELKTHTPNTPHPSVATISPIEVNITWYFQLVDSDFQPTFKIHRDCKKCKTPRFNQEIDNIILNGSRVSDFCSDVYNYFLIRLFPKQTNVSTLDFNILNSEKVFNPVLPIFMEAPKAIEQQELAIAVDNNKAINETRVVEPSDLNLFLLEQSRTLKEAIERAIQSLTTSLKVRPKCPSGHNLKLSSDTRPWICDATKDGGCCGAGDQTAYTSTQARWECRACDFDYCGLCYEARSRDIDPSREQSLISTTSCGLVVGLSHFQNLNLAFIHGMDFIESMLRKQLVTAIGKVITSSDFQEYMHFHNRKLFKPNFVPLPFSYDVRRSSAHSPEGTICIEDTSSSTSKNMALNSPIYTFVSKREVPNSRENNMEFALDASTRISFGGERYLHAWLNYTFSDSSSGLSLESEARQFSSFIILIGRISSATSFDPKYAMIVKDKDRIKIPLNLEMIPSAKEFKDAIESLSPEQQRFAKAFRSMQLESTLFGVCVVQIKPQLEKVLRLSPDSLTKEIELNQNLLDLFIDYQIPSDLLSFGGNDNADAASRILEVKKHVAAMQVCLCSITYNHIL